MLSEPLNGAAPSASARLATPRTSRMTKPEHGLITPKHLPTVPALITLELTLPRPAQNCPREPVSGDGTILLAVYFLYGRGHRGNTAT